MCEIDDENMKARGFSGSLTLTHRYWFSPYKDTKTRQVALTHGVGGGDKNILIKIAKLDFLASASEKQTSGINSLNYLYFSFTKATHNFILTV